MLQDVADWLFHPPPPRFDVPPPPLPTNLNGKFIFCGECEEMEDFLQENTAIDPFSSVTSVPPSSPPGGAGSATSPSQHVALLLHLSIYLMLGCLGLLLSFSFIVCAFRICICQSSALLLRPSNSEMSDHLLEDDEDIEGGNNLDDIIEEEITPHPHPQINAGFVGSLRHAFNAGFARLGFNFGHVIADSDLEFNSSTRKESNSPRRAQFLLHDGETRHM